MKTADYWKDRFEQIEKICHDKGAVSYREIEEQYRKAQKEIESRISVWYQRFAVNNGITMQEARRLLTSRELAELKWDVNEYIKYGQQNAIDGKWMKQLENASAKAHISRLEALKLQVQQQVEVAFGNQLDSIDSTMRAVYSMGYMHTAFEIQKGVGVGHNFAALNQRLIDGVLKRPWAPDGKNFSDRVWSNKQKLIDELNTTLTQGIILGKDPGKIINAMSKKLDVSKTAAGRLVMTESAAFASRAQEDCFKELDVEEYEIVATLDSHTSEICQDMDGKVFKMSERQIGVNAPPFHVNCRTTTAPYFDDWEELGIDRERVARNAKGDKYFVDGNMTYKEWEKKFVEVQKTDVDFMGQPRIFDGGNFKIKAYEVKGLRGIYTQTNSIEAQNTIKYIENMRLKGVLHSLDGVVVAKNLPGIAAYDHAKNLMYVNEQLCNKSIVHEWLKDGYFIAENVDDILKHEMFHKKHWDFIMTKGNDYGIIKNKLETDLHKYVAEQQMYNPSYITRIVCDNAYNGYRKKDNLNELIAEVLLQEEKGIIKDKRLLELVKRCVE